MDKNYEFEIKENQLSKLRKISRLLNISVNDLVQFSLDELFDLIQNDTLIFLDIIGISERLKEVLEKSDLHET